MKVALVYWSNTGNTEKVANAIRQGLIREEVDLQFWRIDEAEEHSFLDYDLYCIGFPSYNWHTPEPVTKYLKEHHRKNVKAGLVNPSAPRIHGKNALVFCTYSGPHTGLDEAIPAVKYAGQFFEHIGVSVIAEWCILSEFIGNERASTQGRMGDIRGKPTEEELAKITEDTIKLVQSLKNR
jgi:flavorubredoxin